MEGRASFARGVMLQTMYRVDLARTTIDIDETALAEAARELGTSNNVDTVNAALAFVASRHRRAAAFDDPLIWGSPDLAEAEVRQNARR